MENKLYDSKCFSVHSIGSLYYRDELLHIGCIINLMNGVVDFIHYNFGKVENKKFKFFHKINPDFGTEEQGKHMNIVNNFLKEDYKNTMKQIITSSYETEDVKFYPVEEKEVFGNKFYSGVLVLGHMVSSILIFGMIINDSFVPTDVSYNYFDPKKINFADFQTDVNKLTGEELDIKKSFIITTRLTI